MTNPKFHALTLVPIVIALIAFITSCDVRTVRATTVATAHALREADLLCAERAMRDRDVVRAQTCAQAYRKARAALEAAAKNDSECELANAIKHTLVVADNSLGLSKETAQTVALIRALELDCKQ